jgi:hypothetical protein
VITAFAPFARSADMGPWAGFAFPLDIELGWIGAMAMPG